MKGEGGWHKNKDRDMDNAGVNKDKKWVCLSGSVGFSYSKNNNNIFDFKQHLTYFISPVSDYKCYCIKLCHLA